MGLSAPVGATVEAPGIDESAGPAALMIGSDEVGAGVGAGAGVGIDGGIGADFAAGIDGGFGAVLSVETGVVAEGGRADGAEPGGAAWPWPVGGIDWGSDLPWSGLGIPRAGRGMSDFESPTGSGRLGEAARC